MKKMYTFMSKEQLDRNVEYLKTRGYAYQTECNESMFTTERSYSIWCDHYFVPI